ncbi:MSRB5 [Symbiodinium pilosum]|uniref:MSRB5 protein n=1 Tax=Symbiodinium pilosum TaxID=2952 RepID=A0A812INW2_SYMPI|nr:MSRB5 [Symbiodinium pilosum]
MGEPSRDPAAYEVPKAKGSTHLGAASVTVRMSEKEWSDKLRTNVFKVLRKKATEPGHRIKFPQGFDDHNDSGIYICAGCFAAGQQVPLYTSSMKFDCGCGWPGFWTNVQGAVYEQRDADGRRCEILCSKCEGHMGHVFRGEGFGYCTDERHCVNSLSLVFLPAKGGEAVAPSYTGPVFG